MNWQPESFNHFSVDMFALHSLQMLMSWSFKMNSDGTCIAFQGEHFMVQDVYSKADVLNTTGSYGAPNFRQVKGSYPLFGMGQPSLNGFKQVLQRLQAQGREVSFVLYTLISCVYT